MSELIKLLLVHAVVFIMAEILSSGVLRRIWVADGRVVCDFFDYFSPLKRIPERKHTLPPEGVGSSDVLVRQNAFVSIVGDLTDPCERGEHV